MGRFCRSTFMDCQRSLGIAYGMARCLQSNPMRHISTSRFVAMDPLHRNGGTTISGSTMDRVSIGIYGAGTQCCVPSNRSVPCVAVRPQLLEKDHQAVCSFGRLCNGS